MTGIAPRTGIRSVRRSVIRKLAVVLAGAVCDAGFLATREGHEVTWRIMRLAPLLQRPASHSRPVASRRGAPWDISGSAAKMYVDLAST